jgi:SAM-dependent methyltransferase
MDESPSPRFVSPHYQGAAGERYHRDKRGIPDRAFDWVARTRAEKFAKHVTRGDVVLEFGAGLGWNLAALRCTRKIGFDVVSSLAPELIRRGIEYVADTAPLPSGLADVVICHHTLEHLLHPAAALAEMRRLLKADGRLLLVVPAENRGEGRTFDAAEPNHHLYCWNPQTLGNLLGECGFEASSLQLQRYGYDRFAARWASRFLASETTFRILRQLVQLAKPIFEISATARKSAAISR